MHEAKIFWVDQRDRWTSDKHLVVVVLKHVFLYSPAIILLSHVSLWYSRAAACDYNFNSPPVCIYYKVYPCSRRLYRNVTGPIRSPVQMWKVESITRINIGLYALLIKNIFDQPQPIYTRCEPCVHRHNDLNGCAHAT